MEGWTLRDLNWFGLALVHLPHGPPGRGPAIAEQGHPMAGARKPAGPRRPTKLLPQDWLEAQLLRREAEEMLKIKRSP